MNKKLNAKAKANVIAEQAVRSNRNEVLKDEMSNSYNIGIKADLKDPEVTGSDSLDIKLELPFGGKLEIKATSNVTSSVLAQEVLNEQSRKNLEQLGQFLTKVSMAIVPTIVGIKETIREQERLDNEVSNQRTRETEKMNHDREIEHIRRNHEARMLELQLNKEYEKAVNEE